EARLAARVEIQDAEGRIALTRSADLAARLHLPLGEDRVEALPRLDLGPVHGLEIARRPVLEVLVVVSAEQVEASGRGDRLLDLRVRAHRLHVELEAEVLLG